VLFRREQALATRLGRQVARLASIVTNSLPTWRRKALEAPLSEPAIPDAQSDADSRRVHDDLVLGQPLEETRRDWDQLHSCLQAREYTPEQEADADVTDGFEEAL